MFDRTIFRLELLSLIVIGCLFITQSLYAFSHAGLMMHHLPGNHHLFHGRPFKGIPKIPTSENNFPELKKQLRVMHNLYNMDKTIVDVYPGPLERKLLQQRHDSQQENYSNMPS